jgi:hypothetical protein
MISRISPIIRWFTRETKQACEVKSPESGRLRIFILTFAGQTRITRPQFFALMNLFWQKSLLVTAAALAATALTANAQVSASDNFENDNPGPAYDDGIQYGGVGFGALTSLEGTGGGVFDGSLDGARALGIFAGGGGGNTQALGRTTQDNFDRGTYSMEARFDLDNSVGTSGFNIKSGLGGSFGANQELFFGLTPGSGNSSIFISDATGNHTLSLPTVSELRGVNLNFTVSFDTLADTYTLQVTDLSNLATNSFSGQLTDTNGASAGSGAIDAIAFGNFNTGSNQNLIVDDLSMVPEPSTWAMGGLTALGLVGSAFRRFRRVT